MDEEKIETKESEPKKKPDTVRFKDYSAAEKAIIIILAVVSIPFIFSGDVFLASAALAGSIFLYFGFFHKKQRVRDAAYKKGVDLSKVSENTCVICGRTVGTEGSEVKKAVRILDGPICTDCYAGMGLNDPKLKPYMKIIKRDIPLTSLQELKEDVENPESLLNKYKAFETTYSIGSYIKFDDNHRWLRIMGKSRETNMTVKEHLIDYDLILAFEIFEDGNSIASGGVGRALVGGALFGPTGAIVGSTTRKFEQVCDNIQVNITIKDPNCPLVYVDILSNGVKKSSSSYRRAFEEAHELVSKLKIIVDENNEHYLREISGHTENDVTAEIRKYKELLDDGIITEEEFIMKKRQLLGL